MKWPVIKLRDLQQKKRGSIDPSKNSNELFTLYSIPAYDMGEPQILRGNEIGSSKQLVSNGDVLISKIVPHIRRAWVVDDSYGHRQIASGEWIVFNSEKILPVFFRQFLLSDVFHRKFMTTVAGVGGSLLRAQPRLVADFNFLLPPLAEQQRIAELLDTADRILKLRESAIAKLDQLAQSVFVDMFGDPLKPKCKFKTFKIGELISEMRGGASLKPEDFVDSGFPILHKGAIKKHGLIEIDLRKKTFATVEYANKKNSSIVTKEFMAVTLRDLVPTGPSIGLIVNLNDGSYERYLLAQGAYGFKIDASRVTPEYLVALSNMPSFREVLKKFSVGSTQIHMRSPVFTSLEINLPDMNLQNKFSKIIKNIKNIRSVENSFFEKETLLFKSLQHQSFAVN